MSADILALNAAISALVSLTTPRQVSWVSAFTHQYGELGSLRCFVKVVDVDLQGLEDPKTIAEARTLHELDRALQSLSQQSPGSIRLYIEELPKYDKDEQFFRHLRDLSGDEGFVDDYIATVRVDRYGGSVQHVAGTMWRRQTTFELIYDSSLISPRRVATAGAAMLSACLLKTQRRMLSIQTAGGNTVMFVSCTSSTTGRWADRILLRKSRPRDRKKWAIETHTIMDRLASFSQAYVQSIKTYKGIKLNNDTSLECRKELLLSLPYLATTLHSYHMFLCHLSATYFKTRQTVLDPRYSTMRPSTITEIASDALFYAQLSEIAGSTTRGVDHLLGLLEAAMATQPPASLTAYRRQFQRVKSLSKEVMSDTARFTATTDLQVRLFDLQRNFSDSRSVWVLSVLASIFLPLSLACGILSMQSRFTDLHYLLYDFAGVVVLLGTLAMVIILIVKLAIMVDEKTAVYLEESTNPWADLAQPVVRVFVGITIAGVWMLLLSSFLVGMVMDVSLGLRILGFGTAAFAGIGFIGGCAIFGCYLGLKF